MTIAQPSPMMYTAITRSTNVCRCRILPSLPRSAACQLVTSAYRDSMVPASNRRDSDESDSP
jgi:hypothetical protein